MQYLITVILIVGATIGVMAQKETSTKSEDLSEDFPRSRDLLAISELQSGKSAFVFRKPQYRQKAVKKPLKSVTARKGTKAPLTTTSYKLPAPRPSAEIWKRLGLTIWRLRSADSSLNKDSATVRAGTTEYLPVRVSADTEFTPGDKVRLSFESPSEGYLYIIDREIYSDNTVGGPRLIFPSMLSSLGKNRIEPGQMLDIPAQSDRVPFFTLESQNKDWRGELLTIILSPEPLEGFSTPDEPEPIPAAYISELESKYLKTITHYEQVGTEGSAYTAAEQQAGAGVTRNLTQKDPYPQTMFKSKVRKNEPLLVNLEIRIK
jgi:hypothetical protein